MFRDVLAQEVSAFHDACFAVQGWAKVTHEKFDSGAWQYIELNHRYNCLLWDEEDLARRKNVPDSEIAANKRAIDGYNQKRQDAIENIDELLLQRLEGVRRHAGAWLNSETAGSMIDRLSIISLKIFHMRSQTQRADVGPEHIETCNKKLLQLTAQRAGLRCCLDTLLTAAGQGRAYFKIYRQFKMYNDPALNPCLYKNK